MRTHRNSATPAFRRTERLREQVRKQREEARILRDVRKERCVSSGSFVRSEHGVCRRSGGRPQRRLGSIRAIRILPTCRSGNQLLAGVPFRILDPSANHGKSTVVLHGSFRPYFPESATGIRVGFPVRRLYFLHTVGWGDKPGTPVLIYRIHYADGSRIDIPVRMKQEINSWGEIEALPPCENRPGADKSGQETSSVFPPGTIRIRKRQFNP